MTTDTGPAEIPVLTVDDGRCRRATRKRRQLVFVVRRDIDNGAIVKVRCDTRDDTASAPSDSAATSGSFAFGQGQKAVDVVVAVNGDTDVEADEGLRLLLSAPSGAAIADGDATGTIVNDAAPGALSCRASALRGLGSEPVVANSPDLPCRDGAHALARVGLANGMFGSLARLTATGLEATTDMTPDAGKAGEGQGGVAAAGVARLDLTVIGIGITADVLSAQAKVTCVKGGAVLTAGTTITAHRRRAARALEVDLVGTALDVVVGEARADRRGRPCRRYSPGG